jgi:hypothetical protein
VLTLAGYHGTDKIGSSYFVEENYDDFITAKDPPPQIWYHLFEPSSRGHAQSAKF